MNRSQRLPGIFLFFVCMLLALAGARFLARWRRGFFTMFLCFLFGMSALLFSHLFFDRTLAPLEARAEPTCLTAKITDVDYAADYLTVCNAEVCSFDGKDQRFAVELSFTGEADLEAGDRIEAVVLCAPFESDIYGYDERNYKLSRGELITCAVTAYELLGKEPLPLFDRIRDAIAARLDRAYRSDTAGVLKALLIGDKSGLSGAMKRDFRRLGISHILAISGTHFSVLLGLAALLLRLLHLNKKQIYLLLIPLALLYMGISGFSASVCRAGIMALLAYLAFLLGRTRDAYTALFTAVCALIAIHPYAVLDIGLWLSFTATFSILVLSALLAKIRLWAGHGARLLALLFDLLAHIAVTVAVFFGSLPITAICFGEASWIAPLANLLIVPLFEGFLYLAPFAILLTGCAPVVRLTEDACVLICRAASALADHDNLVFSLQQPLVLPIAVCGVLATLLLLTLKLKHPLLTALPAVLTLSILAVYIPLFNADFAKTDRAVFMTLSDNDGFVLASGGETLYIDISTGAAGPTKQAEWIAETLYDPELDGYMPTHYHMRHINTFNKLIARTRIKRLYLPPTVRASDYDIRAALAATAARNGIEVIELVYGSPLEFSSCTVTLAEPQLLKRSTHPVICLSIAAGEDRLLYLGSSFADTALDFTAAQQSADLIIFGQHAPITKNPFTVHTGAALLFASEEISAFADFNGTAHALRKNGSYLYCFSHAD